MHWLAQPTGGIAMAREMRAVRYLTEFAIIFLGVSLSFLAEDLREDRRERAAERESIQRLVQDLESNDFAADS